MNTVLLKLFLSVAIIRICKRGKFVRNIFSIHVAPYIGRYVSVPVFVFVCLFVCLFDNNNNTNNNNNNNNNPNNNDNNNVIYIASFTMCSKR